MTSSANLISNDSLISHDVPSQKTYKGPINLRCWRRSCQNRTLWVADTQKLWSLRLSFADSHDTGNCGTYRLSVFADHLVDKA